MGPTGSVSASPKAFNPGLVPKQERTSGTGGILNLNLGQYQKNHGMQLHAHFEREQYFQMILVSNKWNFRKICIFGVIDFRSGEGRDGSQRVE